MIFGKSNSKARTTGTAKPLSRRNLLRGTLATGLMATLPLPRLAAAMNGNGNGFADGSAIPTKFGVWFFGNGIDPPLWHPSGGGAVGDAWTLTNPLAPLAAHKEHLTVLTGYEVRTGGAHVGGCAGTMTGASPGEFESARLPSIDQVIADHLDQQGLLAGTPYRSIEVGLSKATPAGASPLLHAVSHRGPSAPNYPEYDPHRLFGRLFGVSATSPELRLARKSVLDAVLQDFKGLRAEVGAADKIRLESHAEGIRELEKRLDAVSGACGAIQAPGPEIVEDKFEEAPVVLNDAMSRMLAMAMACDLSHIFSYVFTLPAAHVYYRHLGEQFERSFHEDIVHLIDAIPNGKALVSDGVKYAMESFAVTLDHFAATPTATGGNLLDEMAIYSTSCVSAGWTHEMQDYPLLVVGKANGRLQGNVHHATGTQRNASELLLTLANLYGAGLTSYGLDEAQATAPIPEILAG